MMQLGVYLVLHGTERYVMLQITCTLHVTEGRHTHLHRFIERQHVLLYLELASIYALTPSASPCRIWAPVSSVY